MEMVPKQPGEEHVETVYEKYPGLELCLGEMARSARQMNRLPTNKEVKERFLQAMRESFELVGGVPRMAMWAAENYGDFMKLISKTIPSTLQQIQVNTSGPVQIISPIGSSSLDGEPVTCDGEFTRVPDAPTGE